MVSLEDISILEEGILRKNSKGWYIETPEGLLPLSTLLSKFKNREVRLTCIDLKEGDAIAQDLMKGPDVES